jgi:hypothetical protein
MVEKISASVLDQFPEYHLSWLEMWALYEYVNRSVVYHCNRGI